MSIHRGFRLFSNKSSTLALVFGFAMMYTAVVHAASQYTITCTSCHQMPPFDSANAKKNPANGAIPGNHQKHADVAVTSCAKCHTSGVTIYGTSHRNKVIELDDTLGYGRKSAGVFMNQTSVPPNPLGACSTASCHSNGKGAILTTPAWGSAAFQAPADCSQCHGVAPSSGSHPVTGSKHAAYFGTGTGSCVKCHADHTVDTKPFAHATSVGGRGIEVKFTGGGSFTSGTNQCSNVSCHSNGQSGLANLTTTPTWGGGVTCASCHGDGTSGAALSGNHASHVNNAGTLGSNYGCVECHSATVSGNSTISDTTKHVDGYVTVVGTKVGTITASTTCATSSCHWDGKSIQKQVTWTQTAALGCDGCHGTAAAFGAPAYANGGAGAADANSHAKHATSSATCANCHSKTTTTGLAIIAGSQHTDGFINYTSGNSKTFGKQAGKTCSNISCHSGNGIVANVPAAQWGATLNCNSCHNIPASSVGGSHTPHLAKVGITCEDCHTATASGSTAIKSVASHANANTEVGGGIVTAYNNSTKTCATVCHNGTSLPWGNTGGTTVCGSCHSVGPNFGGNFAQYNTGDTAIHNVHFAGNSVAYGPQMNVSTGCSVCHNYTGISDARHDNQRINLNVTNVLSPYSTLAKGNSGFTATSCTTCHKQSTTWQTARLTCESCHTGALSVIGVKTAPDKSSAATTGHGKSGIVQACTDCHNNNSQHIGVAGGTKRLFDIYSSTTSGRGCNTCHSNSSIVTTASMKNMKVHQISGPGSTCADCHDPHGTTNNMMVNTRINNTTVSFTGNTTFANSSQTGVCQTCHTNTTYFTKPGVTPSGGAHVASTTNCLDCHLHNPTDGGRAFTAPGNCDACHGYPPAPRNVANLVFGRQGQWSSARFEDYSGGGGAHLVAAHIPATAKATQGWENCTPCHKGGAANHAKLLPIRNHVENITVSVDPQLRFSNDTFAIYTTAKLVSAGANKSGSCFNVSCHFTTTLKWSTER